MQYFLSIIRAPDLGLQRVGAACLAAGQHLKDHIVPHARNNYHPHLLGDRALALFSIALVGVKIFTIAVISWGPIAPAFSSAITTENIITLTNQSRATFNLNSLKESMVLNKAAQAKANDMLNFGYFSHNSPDGRTPWSFIADAGYSYLMAGENLAVNFTEAESVEEAWMNSPGHKANILNKHFEEIGIGIAQGQYQGRVAIFVVQMFGVPTEQSVRLSQQPTVVEKQEVPAPVKAISPAGIQGASVESAPHAVGLEIKETQVNVRENIIEVQAEVVGEPVKVIATFGENAVMLEPKSGNIWMGSISLDKLTEGSVSVRLRAWDMPGSTVHKQLADFSNTTVKNYHVTPLNEPAPKVSFMGRIFDPKLAEQKLYLFFIAGILASLILAIGIKRHVQHLNLIANTSLVAIFATLLWVSG